MVSRTWLKAVLLLVTITGFIQDDAPLMAEGDVTANLEEYGDFDLDADDTGKTLHTEDASGDPEELRKMKQRTGNRPCACRQRGAPGRKGTRDRGSGRIRPAAPGSFFLGRSRCPLISYGGSHFENTARVHEGFYMNVANINQYAGDCRVKLYITSSFRNWGAARSNHKVGHAIDMNVRENGALCNSVCLGNEAGWTTGVRCFITKIRRDSSLRWGGDFSAKDPVHIDDGLNLRNPRLWSERYRQVQAAC